MGWHLLSILLITLLCTTNSWAQQLPAIEPSLHIGVRAGVNAVAVFPQNTYGQVAMSYQVPVRGSYGLALNYVMSSRSAIRVDVLYQQMGQKLETFRRNKSYYRDIRLDYVAVPIMYRLVLNPPKGKFEAAATRQHFRYYLSAGIQPAILTSASVYNEIDDREVSFVESITDGGSNPNEVEIEQLGPPETDEELFKSFDINFIGAAGFTRSIRPKVTLFAELRGFIGLIDVNAEEWQLPRENGDYFPSLNMSFGFHAGVVFKIF